MFRSRIACNSLVLIAIRDFDREGEKMKKWICIIIMLGFLLPGAVDGVYPEEGVPPCPEEYKDGLKP